MAHHRSRLWLGGYFGIIINVGHIALWADFKAVPGGSAGYLTRTHYNYLVNGSEDEEFLTRLTDE